MKYFTVAFCAFKWQILTLCAKWRIDKLYLSLIFAILTPLLRMPKIYLLLAKIMLLLRARAPLLDALQLAFTVHWATDMSKTFFLG